MLLCVATNGLDLLPQVDALADLGVTRVTLARETSLHEIAQLAATGDAVGILGGDGIGLHMELREAIEVYAR